MEKKLPRSAGINMPDFGTICMQDFETICAIKEAVAPAERDVFILGGDEMLLCREIFVRGLSDPNIDSAFRGTALEIFIKDRSYGVIPLGLLWGGVFNLEPNCLLLAPPSTMELRPVNNRLFHEGFRFADHLQVAVRVDTFRKISFGGTP